MRYCTFSIFILCLLSVLPVNAQLRSTLRSKNIYTKGVITIDSVSIVPGSVNIQNVDGSFYKINAAAATLKWLKPLNADSVKIHYRVFPFRLNAVAQRFSYDSIANYSMHTSAISADNQSFNNTLFKFGKIDYNGSFGRSMSFGNNQDAVFNSEFNLQMNGYIGDSIHLLAALTDNNIPIQPDGTTQQLNDFDKILIQFSKPNWEINLGDIDLRTQDAYYLNFYKRLQGISYAQKFKLGKNIYNKTLVSGAIAKGKFARNILAVTEGNQGPYHLQGNNNELYFVVLAGTEKVYLDGQLLQRGDDRDYIIDYNSAQITFTAKHLITRDSRVQVEFEYANQNYLNSMFYVNNETQFGKKLKLTVSAYNNSDAKNSPINQTLDNSKIQFLRGIGDSIQNAFYPVAETDTFSTTKILYKKIDTAFGNQHDSIFVYSTNKDSAKYNLYFAEVGANKGNYIPYLNAANGKVYQWIMPVNGVPQGDYEPAEFLVTPKSQQILSVKGEYTLNNKTIISTELATSNTNVNTFAAKDHANDVGYAGKAGIVRTEKWVSHAQRKYTFEAEGNFEFESQYFQTVENLHPVEFARDWGLTLIPQQASEKLGSLNLVLKDDRNNSLNYQFATYIRGDGYTGFRNVLSQRLNTKSGWAFNDDIKLTNISMPNNKGYYFLPNINVSKTFRRLHNYTIGASFASEHNEIKDVVSDTLLPTSYAFQTISAYIKSDESKQNSWSLTYSQRNNKLPSGEEFVQTDHNRNINLQMFLLKNQHQQLRINATYRELYVDSAALIANQASDKSFLGRLEYFVNAGKGFITGNLLYDVGSGQEQKLDYSFYEVAAGQGQYTWNDYNHDGIQQLNEFEIAAFSDEAKYVKIYTPTNVFIKANYTQLNYSLSVNPKSLWGNSDMTGGQKFLSKFNLQSSLQSGKKEVADGGPQFNPFNDGIADTALLNLNYIFSNTISFNKFGTRWGIDINRLINYNKSLLTYGSESTKTDTWNIKARVNISKNYMIELQQKMGINVLQSPAFDNRNFSLKMMSTMPMLTFTNGTKWRLTSGYTYSTSTNALQYGGEKSITNALNFEAKYNAVQNSSITGMFSFSNIAYTGDVNSTVSYTILQGLLPGKNFQWTLNFTKRLFNNLEVNFEYEGRKPGNTRVINIGRASVRAIL